MLLSMHLNPSTEHPPEPEVVSETEAGLDEFVNVTMNNEANLDPIEANDT